MGHGVFISYSSRDRGAAGELCRALESNRVKVWMAPRDLAPSSTWAQAIPSAIEAAQLVVLLFSKHVNASEWVPREIQHAVHTKKRIMTVRLADCEPDSSLSFYLSTLHWLDAFPGPLAQHLPVVVRHCQTLLNIRPEAKPARPAPAAVSPALASPAPGRLAAMGPAQRRLAAMAAAVAALAILAGGLWLVPRTPEPVAAGPDLAAAEAKPSSADAVECSSSYGSREFDNNLPEFEVPSSEPLMGGYAVLDVATLRINGKTLVKLANVGRGDAKGAEKLRRWLERSGPVVTCLPVDDRRCHYACTNEDRQDLSKWILSSRLAAPLTPVTSQN